jgi:hypothetical protein
MDDKVLNFSSDGQVPWGTVDIAFEASSRRLLYRYDWIDGGQVIFDNLTRGARVRPIERV